MADALEQAPQAGVQHEADRRCDDFVRQRLHDGVVNHESDRPRHERDGQPEPRVERLESVLEENGASLVIDQAGEDEAGDPRPRGPPAEPEQRARHELGIDEFLRRTIDLALERPVDPVEEVEVTDPDDAGDHVEPAKKQVEEVVERRVHMLTSQFEGL